MTHQTTILLDLSESDGPETPFDPLKYPVRLLGAQIALAAALGVSAFLSFCFLRRTYPQFYEARRSVKSMYFPSITAGKGPENKNQMHKQNKLVPVYCIHTNSDT